MKISCWDVNEGYKLGNFYNQQVATIPHSYPVAPDEFGAGIRLQNNPNNNGNLLDDEVVVVGEVDGKIVGFAHLGIDRKTVVEGTPGVRGVLRVLIYQPGFRIVGQSILASSEDYFRDTGANRVVAFVGERFSYRFFNVGRGYLMDRLGHVMSLFGMNGFEVKRRKLFLERKDITVPKPVVPNSKLEVITTHDEGAGARLGLTIRILDGKDEMGICISESLGHYQQSEGAQDTYYIGAIRVHPDLQGIGWGKYLLQRTHWEMQELGYKHALLGTELDNHRALLLYTNEGYQVIYTDCSFGKKL